MKLFLAIQPNQKRRNKDFIIFIFYYFYFFVFIVCHPIYP